ncbi:uncharacterized protein G2W53_033309 [Senna tora]|uniref:Uncharacterized protein n=1 Tax=Senna tora TaxID=362788 RepID=A0A834SXC0_9FABA|nr:uncharacterized protein G2W53_033309 [Senna tora]
MQRRQRLKNFFFLDVIPLSRALHCHSWRNRSILFYHIAPNILREAVVSGRCKDKFCYALVETDEINSKGYSKHFPEWEQEEKVFVIYALIE